MGKHIPHQKDVEAVIDAEITKVTARIGVLHEFDSYNASGTQAFTGGLGSETLVTILDEGPFIDSPLSVVSGVIHCEEDSVWQPFINWSINPVGSSGAKATFGVLYTNGAGSGKVYGNKRALDEAGFTGGGFLSGVESLLPFSIAAGNTIQPIVLKNATPNFTVDGIVLNLLRLK